MASWITKLDASIRRIVRLGMEERTIINTPEHQLIPLDEVTLSVYEWGREFRGRQPTLVLLHATGFHARCWDQVIAGLPDRHIVAIDQRGHGRSSNTPFTSWNCFADDLKACLQKLGIQGAIGVGHSMGGFATLAAAIDVPELFYQLCLVDPVIMQPEYYHVEESDNVSESPGDSVSKRRNHFASAQAMYDSYLNRLPFSLFTPEAFWDYCQYGVEAAAGGGVQLACAPEFEARIYGAVLTGRGVFEQLKQVQVPVLVLRAMQPTRREDLLDFRYSPTWDGLAQSLPYGRDVLMEDITHFMPMQNPKLIAAILQEL